MVSADVLSAMVSAAAATVGLVTPVILTVTAPDAGMDASVRLIWTLDPLGDALLTVALLEPDVTE